jgi:hypothetical protein
LAPNDSVTEPAPLPDAGLTVIHDAPLDAVQPQPDAVATLTDEVPADGPTESVVGDTVKVHGAPAWVRV